MVHWIDRHWNLFTLAVLSLGLVWLGLTAAQTQPTTQGQIPAPRQGFKAPAFSLTTLSGEEVSLDALRGKVVIVNIWTTWCAFCESEMPAFQNVYEAFKMQNDIVILAVNSTAQDDLTAVGQFAARKGLQFAIPLDTDGHVTRLYQVRALPTTFFIDRQGIIRDMVVGGPLTTAMIQSRVAALLSQEP
jgi:cytochrome c biogenesis protein CcmG/thiol:disulfide interchange protein DsbE